MTAIADNADTFPETNWGWRFALLLLVGSSCGLISHRWDNGYVYSLNRSLLAHERVNQFADQQEGATLYSVAGYFTIALTGMVCLLSSTWSDKQWAHPMNLLYLFFLIWAVMSFSWSDDPGVSLRKVVILMLVTMGAVGIACRVSMNDLLWIATSYFCLVIVAGIVAEAAFGVFRPWTAGYRLAGTQHPNSVGMNAAMMCLAAGLYKVRDQRWNWMKWAVIAFGVTVLLLTKSRTAFGACLVAAGVLALMRTPAQFRLMVGSLAVACGCVAGILLNFVSVQDVRSVTDAASMGRTEDVGSLTGRLPLWDEVWKSGRHHAMLGFGWGGFWTASRIDEISRALRWEIPNAHNAYLDLVLNLGVVGLLLYLAWLCSAAFVSMGRYRITKLSCDLFPLALVAFVLVQSTAESLILAQGFPSLLLLTSIARLALVSPVTAGLPRPEQAPSSLAAAGA